MIRDAYTIARHNIRLLIQDPAPLVVNLLMPLVFMGFLKPTYRRAFAGSGYASANGSEQAVPGLAVMFSMFWISYAATSFYREHGWGTWERLRASPASTSAPMVGKLFPCFLIVLVQFGLVFTVGAVLYGLSVQGPIWSIALLSTALSIFLVSAAMALVALCNSLDQMQVIANLGALLFAGLGGALTPVEALPLWAQRLALLMPSYWALRGFHGAIFGEDRIRTLFLPEVILLAMSAGLAGVAALRFRLGEQKSATT